MDLVSSQRSVWPSIRTALHDDRRWLLAGACAVIALSSIPYLIAWAGAPAGGAFGGLLANPLDGQTYLAKMALGADGDWLFRMTFTSESHAGAFLNFYYLLLGHIAGWLGLSLILTFHLARIANGVLFMTAAYVLIVLAVPAQRRLAWLLLFFSSGLGWLIAPLGRVTADLLVPEAIAFYGLYTNPHFPLALAALSALLALLFAPFDASPQARLGGGRTVGAALAAAGIALTQPFLLLTVGLVAGAFLLARWRRAGRFPRTELWRGLIAALPAIALTIPQIVALIANPAMRASAAQDVTLSPPLWDYMLSFGILIPLAAWGAWRALRQRDEAGLFLVLWAFLNLALAYIPLNLQRRLIMGAQFPLALLAARGISEGLLRKASVTATRRVKAGLLAFAALSNIFLLALGMLMVARQDAKLFLLAGEPAALEWLADQPVRGAVIAMPRTSAFIPGRTGHPVYYGHPMETLDAKRKEAEVLALFAGESSDLLEREDVGWLLIGPYEQQNASPAFLQRLVPNETAYVRAGVTVYPLGGDWIDYGGDR